MCTVNFQLQAAHLDADDNAFLLDNLGEELAAVCFLVECLVEEDDPTHAIGDGGIGGEEDVTEAATVLLTVLHVDFLETLSHGSLTEQGMGIITVARSAVTSRLVHSLVVKLRQLQAHL